MAKILLKHYGWEPGDDNDDGGGTSVSDSGDNNEV